MIAGLVREAVESGRCSLADVAVPALGEEARAVLAQSSWLESKVSEGGTRWPACASSSSSARALLPAGVSARAAALLRPARSLEVARTSSAASSSHGAARA